MSSKRPVLKNHEVNHMQKHTARPSKTLHGATTTQQSPFRPELARHDTNKFDIVDAKAPLQEDGSVEPRREIPSYQLRSMLKHNEVSSKDADAIASLQEHHVNARR